MTARGVKLAPSILDADFARLGEQVAEAERCGADRIHVDVMDGRFAAGANVLVAGTAVFGGGEGVAAAMKRLRAAAGPPGR